MPNPIIAIAKENWDSHDAHACACEWLFQMARLAGEHEVNHGIDYRDPGGPIDLAWSLETGEDSNYWDAVLALVSDQGLITVPWSESDMLAVAALWVAGDVPTGYDFDRAAEQIRVAVKVFGRLYNMTKED